MLKVCERILERDTTNVDRMFPMLFCVDDDDDDGDDVDDGDDHDGHLVKYR